MTSSNLIIVIIILGQLFWSCDTKHGIENDGTGQSTFLIATVGGDSEVQDLDEFEVPKSRLYNFNVCLKDNLHNRNINNQVFEIHGEQGKIDSRMSDERGCVFWSEKFPYDFFQPSNYLHLKRSIKSLGIHKGTQSVDIAINPWRHGESLSDIVDLRRKSVVRIHTVQDSHKLLKSSPKERESKPIYLSDLNLKITESKLGQEVEYLVELTTSPKVLLKNTKDQNVEVDIMGGQYKVHFELVHETLRDEKMDRMIIAETKDIVAKNIRGQLQTTFPIRVSSIPTDGFYRVLVHITPDNGYGALKEGHALFDLGQTGPLLGSKSGRLLNEVIEAEGQYNTEIKVVKQDKSNGTPVIPEGFRAAGVFVKENLKLSFTRFSQETTTERNVDFQVTACLARHDRRNVGLRDVEVHKIKRDENGQRIVTKRPLQTGQCLTWEDSFRHKYYEEERKFLKSFKLVSKDLGLDVEVPVLVNPWDFGWTFGRDARVLEQEAINNETNEERPSSLFFLRNYKFQELGISYKVDDMLNLKQISHVRFSLDPKAERPSSQTKGRNQVEGLRKGQYLFRLLVRRNDIEDEESSFEYIAHAETIATVTKGEMIADLDLEISNFEVIRSRNRVLIELATVHEPCLEDVDGNHYRPKKKLDLEDAEDKACHDLLKNTKSQNLTYSDVIDDQSGLKPALFAGPIIVAQSSGERVDPIAYRELEKQRKIVYDRLKKKVGFRTAKNLQKRSENVNSKFDDFVYLGALKKQLDEKAYIKAAKSYVKRSRFTPVILDNEASYNEFLEKLNQANKGWAFTTPKPFDFSSIETFINTPHSDNKFKTALCRYFAHLLKEKNELGTNILKELKVHEGTFLANCTQTAHTGKGEKFLLELNEKYSHRSFKPFLSSLRTKPSFTMVRQYLPKKAEQLEHRGGIPYSYGVKTGYSLGRSFSLKTGFNTGVSGKLSFPGGIFGVSGGVSAGGGWSWSQGASVGTGFGLSLDIEENLELLRFHEARKCLVVRMSPHLVNKMMFRLASLSKKDKDKALQVEGVARSLGIQFCTAPMAEPVEKIEHYYYMEQKSGPGILQDPTDTRNRQVKIALRGKNEFITFVEQFEGNLTGPSSNTSKGDLFGDVYEFMKGHINSAPANFPGVYTDLDETSAIYQSFFQ